MKRYLITGSDGFVGSGMKHFLAQQEPDAEIIAIGREHNLFDPAICKNVLSNCGKLDYILHFADVNGNAEWSRKHAADQYFSNMRITLNLLENVVYYQRQARFVGFSSLWAYPEKATNFSEADYWAGALAETIQQYGMSKKMLGSGLAACRQQHELKGTMLVLGSIYGPDDHSDHLVPSLISKMKSNPLELLVWGDGSQVRDFIFLDDQLRGIYQNKDYEGELLNIAGGQPASVYEVVTLLQELMNYRGKIIYMGEGNSHADDRRLDMSVATRYSGWPGNFRLKSLREGLKITIEIGT